MYFFKLKKYNLNKTITELLRSCLKIIFWILCFGFWSANFGIYADYQMKNIFGRRLRVQSAGICCIK
jgi:hypothetical protein